MNPPSPKLCRILSLILISGNLWLPAAVAQDFLRVDFSEEETNSTPVAAALAVPGAFNIVINAGSGLSSNAPALAAFNRAAQQWAAYFSDPITIYIDADLDALGAGIIGSAGSVLLQADYATIRDQLVVDAADEPDNAIVAFLPTAAQFTAFMNPGTSLSGNLVASKANLKAIGFEGLDDAFGASDGAITFSSNFSFDYDNSDGVGAGQMDFETVAAHEIGHVLGFISEVDSADAGATVLSPLLLDLFRFQNNTAGDPSNSLEFTTFARNLVPGSASIIDDTVDEWSLSTGVATGDGRQASHWKDGSLTGNTLGMLDPTLSFGEIFTISAADVRAFDLIGFDVVPEPSSLLVAGLSCVILLGRRKREGK